MCINMVRWYWNWSSLQVFSASDGAGVGGVKVSGAVGMSARLVPGRRGGGLDLAQILTDSDSTHYYDSVFIVRHTP